jgi:uncharacterized protein YkwD
MQFTEILEPIIAFFSLSRFGINMLDVVIVAIIVFYAYEGYTLGFVTAALDLCSFILSFIIALKAYAIVAKLMVDYFSIPIGFANALSFFLVALLSEIILNILFRRLVRYLPDVDAGSRIGKFIKQFNRYLGLIPGMISAFIILSFLLSIIISFPSSPVLKKLITDSKVGSVLVANTAQFEKTLNSVFGGALNETLNFLTVKPESSESVELHFTVANGTVDEAAEQLMFRMLNSERVKAGLDPLEFDIPLRNLARDYSADMFKRGYFSHYNQEGQSPFDRMDAYGIEYLSAGENLALAPSTELAMQGLMNSPGHRANILSPNFGRVGIGVIDGGIYGKMFTQEFTD